jgi:LL-diaminopimelate aminotransferase
MDCYAQRLKKIPPYFFAELECLRHSSALPQTGGQLIDFSEGNPDLPTPKPIVRAMMQALQNPNYHRYPTYQGMLSARVAVAEWYKKRFGVKLDPEKEVCMLLGAKEGIAHLIWGMVGRGDKIAVPDPVFPMYYNQALLSGAEPIFMPLLEENNFLPDLALLRNKKIKLVCLNYPNNPTAAVAPISFYRNLINLSQKQGFYLYNDNVYSEIYFDAPPVSILQVDGAKEYCVEFHSLSKTFNMAGWRIGFAVGNAKLISAMLKIKQNTDSGPFSAIQETAIFALDRAEQFTRPIRTVYKKRLDLLINGLRQLGWKVKKPKATFFVWAKVNDMDSMSFAKKLLIQNKIMVAPGAGFGKYGEGYIRFALVVPEIKIKQTLKRLSQWH